MKSKILNMLKERTGEFVSGAEISQALEVSRQAVSKHIHQMKQQGYNIESVSRKGHRLLTQDEMYNQAEILSELNTKYIGQHLLFLDSIGSTNDYAKQVAIKSQNGMVVISDEQTAGKGRLGREWASEKGTGIWMSVILKPDIIPSEAPKITQIAAAAMVNAIEKVTGESIQIKWPNDLIYNKRKVCGVLTEMSAELGGINFVVVGIGVNVNHSNFPEEIMDKAISLKMGMDKQVSRKSIVIEFLSNFEYLYENFIESGSLEETVSICKEHSILMNKDVQIITKSDRRKVKVIDINNEGQLVVINEKNEKEAIFYGEVSVRGLYEYID